MRISFLCSDSSHPVNEYLETWIDEHEELHSIELVRKKRELSGGDILFLISCSEIINKSDRSAYTSSLVLHASDLPKGRGWSPHIWQIIEGKKTITLSLLEAEDKIDSGQIWKKTKINIPEHALWNEINKYIFEEEIELIDFAVSHFKNISPKPQEHNVTATYYSKRTPEDSKIDPAQSIASQFNKIRVCDPQRFPAFFELKGKKYKIILEKMSE